MLYDCAFEVCGWLSLSRFTSRFAVHLFTSAVLFDKCSTVSRARELIIQHQNALTQTTSIETNHLQVLIT